uniref:Putative maf protein n=1 Tax=Schistosoma mansoni TaxID=6183 RepID=A0A5K4EFP2_SCHMA
MLKYYHVMKAIFNIFLSAMLCSLDKDLKSIDIILASTSPRRKEILGNIGLQFSSICPDVEESLPSENFQSIPAHIEAIAKLKVDAVVNTLDISERNYVVIGADTMVCFEGCIFGKPSSHVDAVNILSCLSGNVHQVITGVCLKWIVSGKQQKTDQFHEVTNVKMIELSPLMIEGYVQSGEPMYVSRLSNFSFTSIILNSEERRWVVIVQLSIFSNGLT